MKLITMLNLIMEYIIKTLRRKRKRRKKKRKINIVRLKPVLTRMMNMALMKIMNQRKRNNLNGRNLKKWLLIDRKLKRKKMKTTINNKE